VENLPRKRNPLHRKGRKALPVSEQENQRIRTEVHVDPYRKLKAQRLRWTTAWRRLHKKLKQADAGKSKKQKVFRK
jgi:large subunit ribosomal protein L24e